MTSSVAVMLGLSLVIVLMITAFLLVRRARNLSPEARYRRDIRALRTSVYLRTEPRPARQVGNAGPDTKYYGGAWLG